MKEVLDEAVDRLVVRSAPGCENAMKPQMFLTMPRDLNMMWKWIECCKTCDFLSAVSLFKVISHLNQKANIMKVNTVILLMIGTTIWGCQSLGFYGSYGYSFVGVSNYNMKDTVLVSNETYSDSLISTQWTIRDGWGFDFTMTNKTDENIEIDWRKVVFISPGNTISRSSVDFNSFIPPMTSMSQRMRWARFTPTPLVSLDSYNYNIWSTYKIIEIKPTYYIEVRDAWKNVFGTKFSVYFPMKIKGKEYNYKFIFEVDKLYVKQQAPDTTYNIMKGENFPENVRTIENIKKNWKEKFGRIKIAEKPNM